MSISPHLYESPAPANLIAPEMMKARGAAWLVVSCGCYHTVTVFVPVDDVPTDTVVVAAVKPGHVDEYGPRAVLTRYGDVVSHGEVVGHVAPSDVLVIEASGGDRFGRVKVTRAARSDGVALLGGILLVGGALASWVYAAACFESVGSAPFLGGVANAACLGLGFVGNIVAALIGGPILAYGLHGELHVDEPRARVTFAPNGLTLRF